MTQEEAQNLTTRLLKVWIFESSDVKSNVSFSDSHYWFEWSSGKLTFSYSQAENGHYRAMLKCIEGYETMPFDNVVMGWMDYNSQSDTFRLENLESTEIETLWLSSFRRGLWLWGVPIECTAHEQMEWRLWLQEQEVKP